MKITFKKYHCLGRDFILLDNRDGSLGALKHTEVARLCARRFGIGASGVLRLDKASKSLIEVKSFNFNGALADLNAMDAACVTVFAKDLELLKSSTNIEINGQIVCCIPISSHENMNVVSVRILEPLSAKKSVQSFVMDFGETPYCMVPTNDVSHTDVLEKGREISYKKRFPKGANVTFYQPNPGFLEIRHYEHQVDQETYTNGLCVIGAALSHAQNNPGDSCLVRAKGGEMQVSFARSDEAFYNVELRVLVNAIYEGKTV